jgi:hypothetical protein
LQVSLEACFKYYLELAPRRFSQHHLFVLIAYDLLQRRSTWRQAHLQADLSEQENAAINKLTEEDVSIAIKYEDACNHARQKGLPIPDPPANISVASRAILRKVKAAAKNVMGTNEEREEMYRQVNAMRNMFGSPHFFLTFNLNEKNAYAVLNYTGRRQTLDLSHLIKSSEERELIIARDPVAAAQFFEDAMCIVYKYVLGIDPSSAKIMQRGGILGHIEHFFAAKETQRRGALHEHVLVWKGIA